MNFVEGFQMIRTMSFSSGVLALLLALAPGVASGHVGLAGVQGGGKVAPADVQRFIGDWTLALQGPDGPGTFDLSVKVEGEKVVAEISSKDRPKQAITDVSLNKETLVLSYTFPHEGNPVDAAVSLTPEKDGKVAARIDFAGGAYTMSGTATRKAPVK